MNKNNKIINELYKLLSGNFFYSILGFINVIYIGRKLQPSEFANFSIAISIFYIFIIANEPLRMLFAKMIPEYLNSNQEGKVKTLFLYVIKYIFILSFLIFVLIFIFRNNISKILKLPSPFFLYIIGIYIIINFFLSIYRGIKNGYRKYTVFIYSFYVESIARLLITILIFLIIRTSISAFASYLFASIIALIYLLYKTKDIVKLKKITLNIEKIQIFLKPLLLFSLSFIAFYSIDLFMAKVYLLDSQAGYYSAASQLSKSIAIIGTSFNFMLLPHITNEYINKRDTLKEFLKIKSIFIFIALLVILIFGLFSKSIMKILYTEKYTNASNLLLPLGIGTLFMTLSSMIGNYFLVIKKYNVFIIPILFIIIEIVLIHIFHSSPLQITHMFLYSQLFMFICLFISLFIFKPQNFILAQNKIKKD